MNDPKLTDRAIRAAFLARAQGAPSAELQQRIAAGVRATRQHRPLLALPRLGDSRTASRLAWAALLAATAIALLGVLAVGIGRPPNLAVVPSRSPDVTPSAGPDVTPSAGPDLTASPVTPGRFEVTFTTDAGIRVVIDIDDRSGRLVEAIEGQEGLITDTDRGDVAVANDPADATVLRVEWFSPAGCAERYAMTIDADARAITVNSSFVEGGDSIGGNCGVTLRFSEAVPASAVVGTLANTPPIVEAPTFGADSLARVVATDGLRVRSLPGVGEESVRLEPLLPGGVKLFVVEGPAAADGYAWYRVFPYGGDTAWPTGWVAVASRDGEAWVEPVSDVDCPSSPMTSAALGSLDPFEALACFGAEEIVVTGVLECGVGDIDYVIGGASWLDPQRYCQLDPMPLGEGEPAGTPVYGEAVFSLAVIDGGPPPETTYRITGHFDDPESATCTGGAFDDDPGISDEEAIQWCRHAFVATEAVRTE